MKSIFRKRNNFIDPVKRYVNGEIEVDKWIISKFVIEKLTPIVGVHPFPLDELMLMTSAICWFSPDYIFEWGTHVGKSARIFYEIKKSFRLNYQLHSIDLPNNVEHIEHSGKERGKYVRGINDVQLLLGDGLDESMKLTEKIGKSKRIFYFLDGDHSYSSVKRELDTIVKNRPTSAILVHDTFFQTEKSGYNIGPYKAVDKILKKNKNYNCMSTNLGLPGMSLLYPKKK